MSQQRPYAPATSFERPKGLANIQRPYAPALYIWAGSGGVLYIRKAPHRKNQGGGLLSPEVWGF
jgi:hypothetical protein